MPSWAEGCTNYPTAARSANAPCQSRLDRRTSVQCSQHCDRSYRRASKLGRDIVCDAGQSQHADMEQPPGGKNSFQIFTAEMPQAEIYFSSGYGLLDRVTMPFELIPDGSADEIGTVRVEPFLNH